MQLASCKVDSIKNWDGGCFKAKCYFLWKLKACTAKRSVLPAEECPDLDLGTQLMYCKMDAFLLCVCQGLRCVVQMETWLDEEAESPGWRSVCMTIYSLICTLGTPISIFTVLFSSMFFISVRALSLLFQVRQDPGSDDPLISTSHKICDSIMSR